MEFIKITKNHKEINGLASEIKQKSIPNRQRPPISRNFGGKRQASIHSAAEKMIFAQRITAFQKFFHNCLRAISAPRTQRRSRPPACRARRSAKTLRRTSATP